MACRHVSDPYVDRRSSPAAHACPSTPWPVSSGNSIGDPYVGVQAVIDSEGYKLIIGYTHENVWTSPTYPNQSTSWPNYANDCTAGCLYNVFTDPTEVRSTSKYRGHECGSTLITLTLQHFEISAANPDKVASLRARIAYWNSSESSGCQQMHFFPTQPHRSLLFYSDVPSGPR